VNTRLLI